MIQRTMPRLLWLVASGGWNAFTRKTLRYGLVAAMVFAMCGGAVWGQEATRAQKRAANAAFSKVVDRPGLPRVLLIGDSISIGYTVPVREALEGVANVHRIPINGGPTTRGLKYIDEWLGDGEWDVIHFNWGLHDLMYESSRDRGRPGKKGREYVPVEQYEANLRELVARMQKTGAKLVFGTTTPMPRDAQQRKQDDVVRYNAAALRVMNEYGVIVNDLYGFCVPRLDELQRPGSVHFSAYGSRVLGQVVADKIREALKNK